MHPDILDAVEQMIATTGPYYSIADLAAGDGAIVNLFDLDEASEYVGDLLPGYDYTGTVDELLPDLPYVHLFILNGQFRALPDPLATLYKIREKAASLLVIDWEDDKWDVVALTETMTKAGLQPYSEKPVTTPDGKFHVWLCKNQFFSRPDETV